MTKPGTIGSSVQVVPEKVREKPDTKQVENILNYAGLWRRFFAFLIDDVLLSGAIFATLWMVVSHLSFFTMLYGHLSFFTILYLLVIFRWIYFAGMESSQKQATIGKMVLGVIVTDLKGNRIDFGRATVRYFSKILSQALFYGGYAMVLVTEKKQGMHDKIADTLVLTKDRYKHAEYDHPLYAALRSP